MEILFQVLLSSCKCLNWNLTLIISYNITPRIFWNQLFHHYSWSCRWQVFIAGRENKTRKWNQNILNLYTNILVHDLFLRLTRILQDYWFKYDCVIHYLLNFPILRLGSCVYHDLFDASLGALYVCMVGLHMSLRNFLFIYLFIFWSTVLVCQVLWKWEWACQNRTTFQTVHSQ